MSSTTSLENPAKASKSPSFTGNQPPSPLRHGRWLSLAALLVALWLSPPLQLLQGADLMPLWLHAFAETFAIVVAMLIFGVGWNNHCKECPGNITILACVFLAVGLIDFAHMLSYKGMPDFITPAGVEKAIDFWLSARFAAALGLLAVALKPWRSLTFPLSRYALLLGSLAFTALVYWLVLFHQESWPRTFIAGQGLTPRKIAAEYTIIAIMLVPATLFYLQARRSQEHNAGELFAATVVTILSELCFTLYSDVTDGLNLLGHIYKVVAYFFFYRAIFVSSVREPFLRAQFEIAERKRVETALRDSYDEIADLYNQAPCGYHSLDRNGVIVRINDTELGWLGYEREEVVGKMHITDLFLPAGKKLFAERNPDFLERGYLHNIEVEMVRKDGGVLTMLLSATARYDSDGKFVKTRATVNDITPLKQAEAALREREATLNSFLSSSPLGMLILDRNLRHINVNPALAEMSGVPVELHLGRTAEEVVPKAAPMVVPLYRRVLESGEALRNIEFSGEVPRYPGIQRWWLANFFPIFGMDGRPFALGGVIMDITERKQMEERLKSREATLTQAQQIGLMGSWEWDLRSDTLTWSDELYRLYGLDPQHLQASHELIFQIVPEEEHAALRSHMESALQQGTSFVDTEYSIMLSDGGRRLIHGRAQVFRDENGQPLRMVGVEQDVTERRQSELALVEAEKRLKALNEDLEQRVEQRTRQLEAANKELEAFSYSVSHDLRAPLRSVDGFSQILMRDHAEKLDETGRDYLQRVRRASKRMGELIDDLLQLSRVSRSELKKETIDLSALVCSVGREVHASNPEHRVEWVIQPGVTVEADSRLMRAMLENLLRNAWKFSAKKADARIEFGAFERDGEQILFVRDNGAGFDMQYAHKLFGAFQRLHRAEEFEGTGIGLAIVQRIVHHHGGHIWAEGTPGEGATFYFTI